MWWEKGRHFFRRRERYRFSRSPFFDRSFGRASAKVMRKTLQALASHKALQAKLFRGFLALWCRT